MVVWAKCSAQNARDAAHPDTAAAIRRLLSPRRDLIESHAGKINDE
jgi:hypothetical protein